MFKKKERNFETIVAPMKKVETDLAAYIGEKDNSISEKEAEQKRIKQEINVEKLEKAKSAHTLTKIADFLGSNLNETDLLTEDEEEIAPEVGDEETPE